MDEFLKRREKKRNILLICRYVKNVRERPVSEREPVIKKGEKRMKNLKKVNENESRKLNGGAVSLIAAAAGVAATWGVIEAGKGFINMGIGIGNKIFKNNAKYL